MTDQTLEEISCKISRGDAVVLTARELKERIRSGEEIKVGEVDVVTCGTFGVMSGTAAILSVPVAPAGTFDRADKIWVSGVPAMPGPCPNEHLGLVDMIIPATASANATYGGGHLFRDLVAGKEADVTVESGGHMISCQVTLAEMGQARIITTRSAFRNYLAMVNGTDSVVRTIFSVTGLEGPYRQASVSGCGEINPLENDPLFRVIGVGTRALLNGGTGYIIGCGTRSTRERPNLAVVADMRGMNPEMMGGFVTSAGPECLTSVAIPIPVLDDQILHGLRVTDDQVPLPVAEIHDRRTIGTANYGMVWGGAATSILNSSENCIRCEACIAALHCPTGAIRERADIDKTRCANCGTCVRVCPGGVFFGDLGEITVNGRVVPIVLRQSDRARAEALCQDLKDRILKREFTLTEKMEDLL